jgi:hypothetical protein
VRRVPVTWLIVLGLRDPAPVGGGTTGAASDDVASQGDQSVTQSTECVCSEIHPADRPCLVCDVSEAPATPDRQAEDLAGRTLARLAAWGELAEDLGHDPSDAAGVLCAVRVLVRECERLARRVKALEEREARAIEVLGGRSV